MAATDRPGVPNSLESIRACLDERAEFIEVDVTALADQDYLLVHDATLEAETSGRGPVGSCTAERARQLRFIRDGQPTEVKVPVLSEVVRLFLEHPTPTRLQLDYKNMTPFPTDEPLLRLIDLIEPLADRVIVSSGADWQLRRLRRLAPWLDLGLDIHFYLDWHPPGAPVDPGAYPRQLGAYGYRDDHPLAGERHGDTARYLSDRCGMLLGLVPGASAFYVNHRFLVQSLDDGFNWADELHRHGIRLDAWTLDVDNPVAAASAPHLLAAGVDQFTTNTPGALRRLLGGGEGQCEADRATTPRGRRPIRLALSLTSLSAVLAPPTDWPKLGGARHRRAAARGDAGTPARPVRPGSPRRRARSTAIVELRRG